jgi:FtsZ-interacting cell division protein YlmF
MAASPLRWFKENFLGFDEDEEDLDTVDPPMPTNSTPAPAPAQRRRGAMMLPERPSPSVGVRHPRSLDDRHDVGLLLKQRRVVTLDLTRLSEQDQGYFLAFIYGVVFALDANIEKITEAIYQLTPNGIGIDNEDAGVSASGAPQPPFAPRATAAASSRAAAGGRDGQEELFWQGR